MRTKTKKVSDTRVELTVTLDAEDLAPFTEAALKKLAKEVRVEGFRKGKVPIEVAKKFIPDNDLNSEVVDQAVRATVIPAFQESQKAPLVLPNVNVTKYVPGELIEYTAEAEIVPEVKLGDYQKLVTKAEAKKQLEAKITEKLVGEVLDNIAHNKIPVPDRSVLPAGEPPLRHIVRRSERPLTFGIDAPGYGYIED